MHTRRSYSGHPGTAVDWSAARPDPGLPDASERRSLADQD